MPRYDHGEDHGGTARARSTPVVCLLGGPTLAVDQQDHARAEDEVRKMELDPVTISHHRL